VRRIATTSFGNAASTSRVATFEAAGLSNHAEPCIIEIKSRRDVRESLDRLSHLLQQPAPVAVTAADEQILALP
jgi:hypothetical protein